MKPVAVFRHASTEGPGHFATFLARRNIPQTLVAVDAGASIPADPKAFSGLVFMGGPMSVNDDLPWIAPTLRLIRAAMAEGIPVLGHCLGGQLMAKALGAPVTRNPVKEIGWGEVRVLAHPQADDWFGSAPRRFAAFHWHGETFAVPEGATRILESEHCANQAFVLGPHLALQCHVEMTADMIDTWCAVGAEEIAAADGPAVQSAATIRALTPEYLPVLTLVAEQLYERWCRGLAS